MDKMHKLTDKLLLDMERKLQKEYKKVFKKSQKELFSFISNVKKLPLTSTWQERLSEFKKYNKLNNFIAFIVELISSQNKITVQDINNLTREIYIDNRNWELYNISKLSKILFKKKSKKDILKEFKDTGSPFYQIAIDTIKDKSNIKNKIEREITEGIMKGEDIEKLSNRVLGVINTNYSNAIKIARTEVTRLENLARYESMLEAQKKGLNIKKQWIATKDQRTRDRHREAMLEIRDLDKRFSTECLYPGDPSAPANQTVNCRCTMTTEFTGFKKHDLEKQLDEELKRKSYEEWGKM